MIPKPMSIDVLDFLKLYESNQIITIGIITFTKSYSYPQVCIYIYQNVKKKSVTIYERGETLVDYTSYIYSPQDIVDTFHDLFPTCGVQHLTSPYKGFSTGVQDTCR